MKNEFTDLQHFCSYMGMGEEDIKELFSLVVNLINANDEVQKMLEIKKD